MLYLVRGLPGSGKSTFARKLKYMGVCGRHFEADMYFLDERGDYIFDITKIREAHTWCQQSTKQALEEGSSVAVSNTFVKLWEMDYYISLAKELGVPYTVITVEGDHGNIHSVPQEVLTRMKETWEKYPG